MSKPDVKLIEYLESFLTENRLEKFNRVLSQRTNHFTVAIEDVYQLHNTSAVIRTCDVFGIQEVNIVEEKNTKQIDREIAMGAQKWVDLNRFSTTKEALTDLKNKGYKIIATSPHAKNTSLDTFDISSKSCFFFGSEVSGLSKNVLDVADEVIKIPMYGFTESLNISVSAAIILQTLVYRLKNSNVNWKLSELEILEKRLDWVKKTIKSSDKLEQKFHESNE